MITKKHREEIRTRIHERCLNPLRKSEEDLLDCLDDLDKKDKLISNLNSAMKISVLNDGVTVIVVGLDKDGNTIDPDGTLFGPESGRDLDQFDEQVFNPFNGDVVIIDPRSSVSVV